jgi:uncharacterized RDD family membrane protein YckC
MNWYYAREGRQIGPVNDEELQAQVAAGVIRADTLVWNEGMTGWEPYGSVSGGTAGRQTCSQCGRVFGPDEMLRFGDRWVCASCKPVFVQGLKEGNVVASRFAYGGFWIRFGALIIDGIILAVVRFVLLLPVVLRIFAAPQEQPTMALFGVQILANLIDFAIRVGYETYFVGRFGATPGKMACGLKIVLADGGKVGYGRAVARVFAKILSSLTLGIGFIMAAFDEEKRTLHDRICDTRVVKT